MSQQIYVQPQAGEQQSYYENQQELTEDNVIRMADIYDEVLKCTKNEEILEILKPFGIKQVYSEWSNWQIDSILDKEEISYIKDKVHKSTKNPFSMHHYELFREELQSLHQQQSALKDNVRIAAQILHQFLKVRVQEENLLPIQLTSSQSIPYYNSPPYFKPISFSQPLTYVYVYGQSYFEYPNSDKQIPQNYSIYVTDFKKLQYDYRKYLEAAQYQIIDYGQLYSKNQKFKSYPYIVDSTFGGLSFNGKEVFLGVQDGKEFYKIDEDPSLLIYNNKLPDYEQMVDFKMLMYLFSFSIFKKNMLRSNMNGGSLLGLFKQIYKIK